jgi:hypothetical protein
MTIRTYVLGGVATMAVAGALFAASPSFAQDNLPPQDSSPAERAQTEDLNSRQSSQGEADAQSWQDYNAARDHYQTQQSQYDNQLRAYQDKNQDYQQQRQNYDANRENYQGQADQYDDQSDAYADQSDRFDQNARDYDEDTDNTDHPLYRDREHDQAWRSARLIRGPEPLRGMFNAPVEDASGYVVGHFRRLIHDDDGGPEAVITLHNNKTIVVAPEHLRFDSEGDRVLADLDYNELNSRQARF